MLVIAMVVCLSEDKINIFGSIEDLYVRGIVYQAIHPYLFEADIANAEICFTVSLRIELLIFDRLLVHHGRNRSGQGQVELSFGYDTDDVELVSGNSFSKITLGFYGDSNDGFLIILTLPGLTHVAGNQKNDYQKKRYMFHIFFGFSIFSLRQPLFSCS